MTHWFRASLVMAVIISIGVVLRAEDNPEKKEMKEQEKELRLIIPWKHISNLTDEQKSQIKEIHQQALEEIKAIKQRERSDVMAVLTDEQKAEVAAYEEKEKAEQKIKAAEKKEKAREDKNSAEEKPAQAPAP